MREKIFHLQQWTPKIQKTAERLIEQINNIAPELDVLFMGAAALKLPGKNDVDLDILCNEADITTYTERLLPILGQPKEARDDMVAWEFERDGFEIDVILSDPKTSHVALQRKRFELLKENQGLRDEYRKLKEASDGIPYAEYEKRKAAFLEEKVFSGKG